MQVCNSDADIKSALHAWSGYDQAGQIPADLYKQAHPLRQAFAPKVNKVELTSGSNSTPGASLKATEVMTGNERLHRVQPASTVYLDNQQHRIQAGHSPQQSENLECQLETDADAHHADDKTHNATSARQSQPHDQDSNHGETAGTETQLSSGPQTHTQKATGGSQNAFDLLMRASKVATKGRESGVGTSNSGLQAGQGRLDSPKIMGPISSGSKGIEAVGLGGRAPGQSGWCEALQRVAAKPERCVNLLTHDWQMPLVAMRAYCRLELCTTL